MTAVMQTLVSGLLMGGIYALISVGLALIFGVIELVNFSHAEYLMVAMYACYLCVTVLGIDPYLSFPIVLLVMILMGLITFKGIMQRVLNAQHEIQILATLAVMLILQNLALMLFSADYKTVRTAYSNTVLELGPIIVSLPRLIAFVTAIAVSVGLYLYLKYTYTGTSMRAISQNNRAAQLMGIKLKRTYCVTFTLGISMCAVGGVLLTPIYQIYPLVGADFLLPAFVVVVIGGLSSIPGAIVAGLLVGVVESMSAYFFGAEFQQVAYFILFILVIILKPEGILARRKKEGV